MRKKVRDVGYSPGLKIFPVVSLIVFSLLCLAAPAFAHRVYLYAWVEGDNVYTESYFGSNSKVKKGLIEVFDIEGKKLLEGHTNTKGEFSFKIPQKTDLRIVVNAGMGHRGEYLLKAAELGGGSGVSIAEKSGDQAKDVKKTQTLAPVQIDMDQVRKMVEQALDSRLRPIARSIAKLQEEKGPGLTEIIGGIGYIFGIMGLLLFFRNRKRR